MSKPVVRLARAVHFSAGHSYRKPELSDAENRAIYGELFQPRGFGHNFKLEAHFQGEIDPLTGMIENLAEIDKWLKGLLGLVDHRYLNDLPELKGRPATAELIAEYSFQKISAAMGSKPRVRLIKVRLYEGESTWVDVFAQGLSQAERDF